MISDLERARELLDSIRAKRDVWDRLIDELELQVRLMELGIDPEKVVGVMAVASSSSSRGFRSHTKDVAKVKLDNGEEVVTDIPYSRFVNVNER